MHLPFSSVIGSGSPGDETSPSNLRLSELTVDACGIVDTGSPCPEKGFTKGCN